ncbi:MAG: hypothetical protein KGJ78_18965 [Alphaproteobacteria bacterium]|nr:hypothetical protein [Alphaproteobacteria bacterium]
MTWILLLAFALQSYITQTHMHPAANPAANAPIVKNVSKAPASAPADRDALNCPFCQAIAMAGAFFTPAAPLLFLPALWVMLAAPHVSVILLHPAFARGWHSRAPPRH